MVSPSLTNIGTCMRRPVCNSTCLVGVGGIAGDRGFRPHDLQVDGGGQAHTKRLAFIGFEHHDLVIDEVVDDAFQHIGAEAVLLEGLGVHEMIEVAVVVEVLDLAVFRRTSLRRAPLL